MMGDLVDNRTFIRRDDKPTFDRGDVGFIILCCALATFMMAGLAMLYSGLSRRKSALSLIWVIYAANAVVIFQWFFWGYSLAFSSAATNGFIGDLQHFALLQVLDAPAPATPLIPELLFSLFQMQFATVTLGILVGAFAERGRMVPAFFFSFFWCTLVYCPLAYWAWGKHGWASTWGVMDFAGGGPAELGSGVGGLAYAFVLGRRHSNEVLNFRPHNVTLITLGTMILWFGWIGFNAGSAYGANLRAVVAAWNSFICAALGGITWCLIDYRHQKKYSMVGFSMGTVAGLVVATPSSGFLPPWASILMGIAAGVICNYGAAIKYLLRIDDTHDLFTVHAIGGTVGLIANAIFGDANIVALDGVSQVDGGFLNKNWKQLYKQLAYIAACASYTFVMTVLIAKGIDYVPGLNIRTTEAGETIGLDDDQIGEFANDYIENQRDFIDWATPTKRLRHVGSEAMTLNEKSVSSPDILYDISKHVVKV